MAFPQVIREYGEAFRGDWSPDAIGVRGDMNMITGWFEEPGTYPGDPEARNILGLCPARNGHWEWLHCDDDCTDEDN